MAPILIDHRSLKKLGFIAVLITLLTFAGCFLLGYQQATVFYATNSDIERQAAEISDAGEETDVDQSEVYQSELAKLEISRTKKEEKSDAEIKQQDIKQDKLSNQAAVSSDDKKPATAIESINAANLSKY